MECKVPPELAIELKNLAPVFDPLHSNLEFIPSFACFHMDYDFGRSIPAFVYFMLHNLMSDVTEYSTAQELMNEVYQLPIIEIDGQSRSVSNLFGGPYTDNNQAGNHQNWFRKSLERTLLPTFGVCLEEQPTLVTLPLTIPTLEDDQANPYTYLTLGSRHNLTQIQTMMLNISKFIDQIYPSAPTLGSFLGTVSGITILSHSIESPTLPTWHSLPTKTLPKQTKVVNDTTFANKIHFCAAPQTYDATLEFPADPTQIETNLYLVEKKKYLPADDPVKFLTFTPKEHLHPDTLWFQPYSRGTGELNHSLVLGLKIESAEIDGLSIPIPNPALTLVNQNSEYRQGSIPITSIIPTSHLDNATYLRIRQRVVPEDYEPLSFNRRTISKNVLPTFANVDINKTVNGTFPFDEEKNHQNFEVATTYCHWDASIPCPTPDQEIYIWSSYRYRQNPTSINPDLVYFYYSLRGLYGLNTILSKSRNPALLLPM